MHPLFSLSGRTAIITGGAGLLGKKHAEVIAAAGGIPILLDLDRRRVEEVAAGIAPEAVGIQTDITNMSDVIRVFSEVEERFGTIDILINNAASNPKMEGASNGKARSRVEQFTRQRWQEDIDVGLYGAFLCSKEAAQRMARNGQGVILNIASDLGVIAPDQRLYEEEGLPDHQQAVKPVTYSVVKHGILGLTKYFASYYGPKGVRINALSPGGVKTRSTNPTLEQRLRSRIPMGRMASADEYQGAVLFLCSDASSYMTGHNLIVDGGRCCR